MSLVTNFNELKRCKIQEI